MNDVVIKFSEASVEGFGGSPRVMEFLKASFMAEAMVGSLSNAQDAATQAVGGLNKSGVALG